MAGKEAKYYWLKLKDDFFLDKRIKKLRKSEAGDSCVIIYLKMMLAAMKSAGVLKFEGLEDNYYEELAMEINEDEELCRRTLDALMKYSLLETDDGKTYYIPQVASCTGSESPAAERMRKVRKNRADESNDGGLPQKRNNVTQESNIVQNCYTEIEKEKEKEKEKDIDIEIEINKDIYSDTEEEEWKEYAALNAAASLPLPNNKEYYIFNDEIKKWTELYPDVDIPTELKIMKGWLEANPDKQKEKVNIPRFINAWFTRKQEKLLEQKKKADEETTEKKENRGYGQPSYDIERAIQRMNTTVPTLRPKTNKRA